MVSLAGADPITTGDPNSYAISLEKLIEADPQVIILGTNPFYMPTPEAVKARAGWKVMTRGQGRPGPDRRRHRDHPAGSTATHRATEPGAGDQPGRPAPGRALSRPMSAGAVPAGLGTVGLAARIRARPGAIAIVGLVLLAITLVVGVGVGTVRIAPADTIGIILSRAFGIDIGGSWTPATETIVWDLRLPRVLTAMLVGCGLALAGATFQGVVRNPLADPYVLGTASGAALGAAIAVLIPVHIVLVEFGLLHGLAFVGALLAAFVVLRLGGAGSGGG